MMITVGEILSRARAKKNITLEQAEKAIRIRVKFLKALEENDFSKLPPGTFTRGFIKNYASYLGVPADEALAFYRRQTGEEKAKIPNRETEQSINKRFKLTPQFFTFASVGVLLALFFAYLIFSYFKYVGAPYLAINSPANYSVIHEDQIEVKGKADPEASLSINNESVNLNQDGSFSVKIPLQPGLNTLTITATNKFNKQSTVTRNVRLEK